jgi:DNA-binding XRE family transcriptional regulator
MLGHTRTRRTNEPFYSRKADTQKDEQDKPMSLDDFIEEHFEKMPSWAIALKGLRRREGLSQVDLGNILGIAQTNISQMELGKRPIGKTLAKKFADFFKTDYHLFL